MSPPFSGLTLFVMVTCFVAAATAAAVAVPSEQSTEAAVADTADDGSPPVVNQSLASRDEEDGVFDGVLDSIAMETDTVEEVKDTSLVDTNKGHEHRPHNKEKKKKPMGKHKKKKQSFKDKLMPLLLIPFVIQTMLIPLFIMNLKFLALKAMTVGKFAILLIVFNMIRSWQQNAHSTSIRGSTANSMLMAQNYGYSGVPEFGALFNGR